MINKLLSGRLSYSLCFKRFIKLQCHPLNIISLLEKIHRCSRNSFSNYVAQNNYRLTKILTALFLKKLIEKDY